MLKKNKTPKIYTNISKGSKAKQTMEHVLGWEISISHTHKKSLEKMIHSMKKFSSFIEVQLKCTKLYIFKHTI